MKPPRLTPAEAAAVAAHGEALALRALAMNEGDGEGPSTIATYLSVPFRTADALINAGRKLHAAGARLVASLGLADGPLFEHYGEEGDVFLFYNIALVAVLPDGSEFIHHAQEFGHGAREKMGALAERVDARGWIDLAHWNEAIPGPTLEERLEPFGLEWQLEQRERAFA
jgi:hypothetical protein